MSTTPIVVWEEDGGWLGYLQEYPDYWTQGETHEDLRDHLKDLYLDITSGTILKPFSLIQFENLEHAKD